MRTARLGPSSRVKRSRVQSQEAPSLLCCSAMVRPYWRTHSQTLSRKASRPISCRTFPSLASCLSTTTWVAIPGVVAAREPEGWVAHHAMPADESVLGGGCEGVAEVEFTRNVGWGHDDDERLLTLLYGWDEVAVVEPKFVDATFDLGGVVDLGDAGEVFGAGGHVGLRGEGWWGEGSRLFGIQVGDGRF